jgi:hypothetical protein
MKIMGECYAENSRNTPAISHITNSFKEKSHIWMFFQGKTMPAKKILQEKFHLKMSCDEWRKHVASFKSNTCIFLHPWQCRA